MHKFTDSVNLTLLSVKVEVGQDWIFWVCVLLDWILYKLPINSSLLSSLKWFYNIQPFFMFFFFFFCLSILRYSWLVQHRSMGVYHSKNWIKQKLKVSWFSSIGGKSHSSPLERDVICWQCTFPVNSGVSPPFFCFLQGNWAKENDPLFQPPASCTVIQWSVMLSAACLIDGK